MQVNLPCSREIKVTSHEGRKNYHQAAGSKQPPQSESSHRTLDVPNDYRHWPPLPNQKDYQQIANQHVSTPFDMMRDNLCPPPFESLSCHYAVLDSKYAKQDNVDQKRPAERFCLARINC